MSERALSFMSADLTKLRNIGVVAHIDAGKTTVTERMLFYCGYKHRMGEVDKGTTETDFDPEEQQRGITIYSAAVTFPWKDVTINLIDTPGHVDFTAEVERSLRVLDGAVVVFSAREGVEAQSETVWRQADRYHVPRVAFINKMDREGADFYATVDEIEKRLGAKPLPISIPFGSGPPHFQDPFRGIVDLIDMKLRCFPPEVAGKDIVVQEVPPEVADDAQMWRAHLLDQLSLFSDELTERLLAEEPVAPELVHRVLRDATLHNMLVPVLCGSALDKIGIQPLLDAVRNYLPSPLDMPPVEGLEVGHKQPRDAKKTARKPDPREPFCGLLFKIVADKHGDMHYVRVYSGCLKANSRVLNPGKDKKENVPQLWRLMADRREQISEAQPGDIVGVIGLRHSITGDTLCDPKHPILLETICFPETVISMAIEPESATERKKLAGVLEMLKRQDPTFRASESSETGQTLISGMGELHLEVIKHRLLRDFNLNVKVHNPRVSYRETIAKCVETTGACHHRMIAGHPHTAELSIRMEPAADCTQPVVVTVAGGVTLPPEMLQAAIEVLQERGEGGGSFGFPLMKVRITITGGHVHETESNELAFRFAAADAFERALREAGIVLLEPVMRLEVTTPEDSVGEIVSDLQQRRAQIQRTHVRGATTIIEAHAPLASLFGYSSAMRGLTQGRATCTMEPHTYGPAPPEVLEGFM
ncbi:MAG: elongation factor G [Thermoguttaceae bacterium]|jgi:elongation factor G|nr:elongation factor G [Thermoguttaceae bacterium]